LAQVLLYTNLEPGPVFGGQATAARKRLNDFAVTRADFRIFRRRGVDPNLHHGPAVQNPVTGKKLAAGKTIGIEARWRARWFMILEPGAWGPWPVCYGQSELYNRPV